MSEQIKLDGILFGYDTLVKAGEDFIALSGPEVPELTKGMKIVLLGDSRGYVPSGFKPGQEVTIVGFVEAFKHGESDHIVSVTDGTHTGRIKPSNIQRNVVHSGPSDPVYRRIRQAVGSVFAEFMDTVYLHMTDVERQSLSVETWPFVNAIVSYALTRLPEFSEQLAETISRKYIESPTGERFIQDPLRTNKVESACLFLDQDGNIVTVKNPEIVWSSSTPGYLFLKGYESYKVLTGPLTGRRFSPDTRPLGEPVYHPGMVARDGIEGRRANIQRTTTDARDLDETSSYAVDPHLDASASAIRSEIFVSYSHKDRRWLERLQVHLKPLERLGGATRWDDTKIDPGSQWRDEIKCAIESARVVVLLVSADFLASDFIAQNELPPLLAAAKGKGSVVLPVIVSPCRFKETPSLSSFQAVNDPLRPLSSLSKSQQEQVFVTVANTIEKKLKKSQS